MMPKIVVKFHNNHVDDGDDDDDEDDAWLDMFNHLDRLPTCGGETQRYRRMAIAYTALA